ncbi:MAG: TonB-dependent siderophore receptor [Leptolyngbyaceae cyanobacterium RM1_406_9]|nr:TonB-dependent siderophore receptor [Leptolyngbyaceae cyanobacterium RM1_406_9]
MMRQLYLLGWFVGVLLLSIPATVRAEVQEEQENSALAITQAEGIQAEGIQAEGVQAEVAQGITVQVIAVRLNSTVNRLEVILETIDGQELSPTTSVIGNALVADIPNAVLALPDGNEFQQANPIEGVALVSVTQRAEGIRVAITGTEAPPTAEVRSAAQGLVLNVAPGTEVAETDEDAIQVVVTGEQEEGYAPTDATSATRTDTPLRDTPRTIQVIPEQVLEDQAITRVTDAVQNVSGVVQDGGFGRTSDQLNIRGFFTDSVFIDGFRSNGSGFSETANIERIEVLRGPASVLFGNVQPSGVINLVTEQPLEDPFYELELQAGNYTFIRPTIDMTGPLNDDRTILYRLNVAYEYFDGFRDFEQDVSRIFVAPSLEFRIGDATTLNFDFSYLRDERPFDRGFLAIGRDIIDIPVTRLLGEPNDIRQVEEYSAGYRLEHEFSDDWRIRNQFRLITSDDFDFRAEPLELNEETGILSRNFRSNDDFSEVYSLQTDLLGNFSTGSIEHNLLVGFDLRRQTFGGTQQQLPSGLTPDIDIFDPEYDVIDRPDLDDLTNQVRDNLDRTDALGIVLQDQIDILDNLILVLGGRFDAISQESRDNQMDETSEQDVTAFSPTVGIVYQPIEPISLYANYARSFQPNFGTGVDGEFLEPERGTQYEVGIRAEINNRLVASLAAYDITKSNVATTDPDNPDFSIGIGEQRSRGIDLNVAGEVLSGWNVIASYGLIDAEVTESNDLPAGSRVQNVPRNTASLWTTYEIQRGDLQGLGFGLGLFYIDERAGDFEDTFDLPSYLRTDAAVFYRRDNWRAAINVQNLFDVEYFRSNNFGRVAIEPGAPFTIIGSLAVEF